MRNINTNLMIERIKSVVRIKLLSLTVELTKRMPRRWYGKDDKTKMKYQSFTKTSNLSTIIFVSRILKGQIVLIPMVNRFVF